ncbi:hypothetical protein [Lacibacter cauensis]|nr:hypothetical protein [Lacibacter cauensis]
MIRINPSGSFLMNFCYVNLWSNEGKISLLSGGNLFDKLQFQLVKRRTKSLLIKTMNCIHGKREMDFEGILSNLSFNRNDIWDRLFIYTIINHVVFNTANGIKFTTENNVESVLSTFLSKIKVEQNTPSEILDLKIEKIKLNTKMELLQLTASKFTQQ